MDIELLGIVQTFIGRCFDKIFEALHVHPTNNAITYFVTQMTPLSSPYLQNRAPHMSQGIIFPDCLSGLQLSFLKTMTNSNPFDPISQIPSSFWLSRTFTSLPSNPNYRKKLCQEIFDISHRDYCGNTKFHRYSDPDCSCIYCGKHVHPYHSRFCSGIMSK